MRREKKSLSLSGDTWFDIIITNSMKEDLVGIGGKSKLVSLKRNVRNIDPILYETLTLDQS